MLVASADLPRTKDGLVPDVMVNPGGLISRMTVAQLIEMVAGKAAVLSGATMNATAFCNDGDFVQQLGDTLQGLGAERAGDEILYSGITGQQVQTEIFMCPLYFMRLKHLTDDKVNSRGAGRREIRTHQPTGGRSNEGGLRVGEMERDSLCAHAVSCFLQESMMKRGDATDFWICNGCGRMPIYNEAERFFVCPTCDGPLVFTGTDADTLTLQLPTKQSRASFSKIAIPYAMKLLDQELTTFGNMGYRFITESSLGRLKETAWPWPSMEIEFKAEDRGITAVPVDAAGLKAGTEAAQKPKRGKKAVVAEAPTVKDVIEFSPSLQNEFLGFSNMAMSAFRITGNQLPNPDGTPFPEADPKVWPSVEHYYQAMKFPSEPEYQEQIRQSPSAATAKKMGNSPTHSLRGDWEQIKDRVMKAALVEKFKQNPTLLSLLQKTDPKPIHYISKVDAYWGTKGLNRLGALLEEVRRDLKDERPDLTAFQGTEFTVEEDTAANLPPVEAPTAEEQVQQATEVVRLATIPEVTEQSSTETKPQQGGVYLFVNSAVPSHAIESRAKRARNSGPPRSISWAQPNTSDQLTSESSVGTEVKVEKLG
jgi:ribA/ribD-fused uncharacterized protein